MNTKNISIASVVIALAIVGGFLLKKPNVTEVTQSSPVTAGSVSSPEINSPYIRVGSVARYYAQPNVYAASTTLCAIQSPSSTSTLGMGGLQLASSSVNAYKITFAKSTGQYLGSTTPLMTDFSFSANAQMSTTTETPSSAFAATRVFAPNNWFIVTLAASDAGLFAPAGECTANWTVL